MDRAMAFLAVDMDNFSAFEGRVDVASRLKQAIDYIENFQAWRVAAGRLSMNQATAASLAAANVSADLKKICDEHQIEIKTFSHNQKEIVDHDLLTEIAHKIGSGQFHHVAVITNDAKAFVLPIERFPKTRFFIVISESEIGDNVRARFSAYPNVEVFTFGFGRLESLHRRRHAGHDANIHRRSVNVPRAPKPEPHEETWPGVIPAPVQKFLGALINICQVCGYRTIWSPDEPNCVHCGGGLKLNHLNCRPLGRNPLHPSRFFAIYEPDKYDFVAGLVVLPWHLQWQAGDSITIGRYDVSQSTVLPIDDWLHWLNDAARKYLAREQLVLSPNPDTPPPDQGQLLRTKKDNVLLERAGQLTPVVPESLTALELGDYLHIGTERHRLCVLHYLGRNRYAGGALA
jgi:hypothetical protein